MLFIPPADLADCADDIDFSLSAQSPLSAGKEHNYISPADLADCADDIYLSLSA